jgi:hypothetical protein
MPAYYLYVNRAGKVEARNTQTGRTTSTVIQPHSPDDTPAVAASAGNGLFFVAADRPHSFQEQIYRFRVTARGQVTGLTPVPGGLLPQHQEADAMAVAPGGRWLAIGISREHGIPTDGGSIIGSDVVSVINLATGTHTIWRGGTRGQSTAFGVASLSTDAGGRRLVVAGQWCRPRTRWDNEICAGAHAGRVSEVWSIDPGGPGGPLSGGRHLLRGSPALPDVVQAVVTPDGSSLAVVSLTGPKVSLPRSGPALAPSRITVWRVDAATGARQRVIARVRLGATSSTGDGPDFVFLSRNLAGHWVLAVQASRWFAGYLDHGRLIPLHYGELGGSVVW